MLLQYETVLHNIRTKVVEKYGERGSRSREDLGHKALYSAIGIEKSQWSVKWDGKHRFTFEEIAKLAHHLEAPPGWPYTSWEVADANRRALEYLARMVPTPRATDVTVNPTTAAPSGHTERRRRGGRK